MYLITQDAVNRHETYLCFFRMSLVLSGMCCSMYTKQGAQKLLLQTWHYTHPKWVPVYGEVWTRIASVAEESTIVNKLHLLSKEYNTALGNNGAACVECLQIVWCFLQCCIITYVYQIKPGEAYLLLLPQDIVVSMVAQLQLLENKIILLLCKAYCKLFWVSGSVLALRHMVERLRLLLGQPLISWVFNEGNISHVLIGAHSKMRSNLPFGQMSHAMLLVMEQKHKKNRNIPLCQESHRLRLSVTVIS